MEAAKDKLWDKGSLGDEDDVQNLNTCIAQRKHVIPHFTMKTNGNIIECCNNTHQEAPHTANNACALDAGDGSHVTCLKFVAKFICDAVQ